MTIKEKIHQFKNDFNIHFENEIQEILKQQRDFHPAQTSLDEPLRDIILTYTQGGKRIRPFLISYFAENADQQDLLELCLASELFHLAALIHDDIMDESEMRRGADTLHVAAQKFSKKNDHLGADIALLLGDVFLTASIAKAAKLSPAVFAEFHTMIQRTIRGQYLDSFGMNQDLGETSEQEILARHELKTAWYTFTSPARLGSLVSASRDTELLDLMTPVMQELGLLFQIRDDIIDCIDKDSGKKLFSDIMENQTTWVTLHIKKHHPDMFTKIIAAQKTRDFVALEEIFSKIDLHTPYKNEFKKRKDLVENIPSTHPAFQKKALAVLELLELK